MLKVIFVALFVAAAFAVYKWYASVKAEITTEAAAVEAKAEAIVTEVKAKL